MILGTFLEGIILIVLAIGCAVLAKIFAVDWLLTMAAPGLFTAGLAYAVGGAVAKRQTGS
jgi:hypothetical protein